jgi:hypothetical protein
MEKIAIEQLHFIDPQGNSTLLGGKPQERLLLIFHRHLA